MIKARKDSQAPEHLGLQMRRRLTELGRTQGWLADAVGVSRPAVTKWLRTGKGEKAHLEKALRLLTLPANLLDQDEPDEQEQLRRAGRVQAALLFSGRSKSDIADFLGFHHSTVSRWSLEGAMTRQHSDAFARLLGYDPEWIWSGKGGWDHEPTPSGSIVVPILQDQHLLKGDYQGTEGAVRSTCATAGMGQLFWYVLQTTAMQSAERPRSLPAGSLLLGVLDPDPEPMSIVIAVDERTRSVAVRQLNLDGRKKLLVPFNAAFESLRSGSRDGWTVIARVVRAEIDPYI